MAEDILDLINPEDFGGDSEETPAGQPTEEAPDQPTNQPTDQPEAGSEGSQEEPEINYLTIETEDPESQPKSFEETLQAKYNLTPEDLSRKLAAPAAQDPAPGDNVAKKIAEYMNKGIKPEQAVKLVTGLDKMTDIELIKFDYKVNKPRLTEQEVDVMVETDYQLHELEDLDERGRILATAKLKSRAQDVRDNLSKLQKDIDAVGEQQENQLQEESNLRVEQWNQKVPDMLNAFEELIIDVDKNTKLRYSVTQAQKEALKQDLLRFVEATGIRADEEGLKTAEMVMKDRYKVLNFDKLVRAVALKSASKAQEGSDAEHHNPFPSGSPQEVQQGKERKEDLADFIARVEGL